MNNFYPKCIFILVLIYHSCGVGNKTHVEKKYNFSQYVISVESSRYSELSFNEIITDSEEILLSDSIDNTIIRIISVRMLVDTTYNFDSVIDTLINKHIYRYYAFHNTNSDNIGNILFENSIIVDAPYISDIQLFDDYQGKVLLVESEGKESFEYLINFVAKNVRLSEDLNSQNTKGSN